MLTSLPYYVALTLLCLAVFLPGLTVIPPLDRDEARFAQSTRQMMETGHAFDLRFQEAPRYKKPHGAYWLQAGAVAATGERETRTIWPHRLPSLIGAWAAVLLTFAVGARLFDRRTALLGAAILGTSAVLLLEANQAKTDALLLATVVGAQAALARIWLAARDGPADPGDLRGAWLVFWLAQAAGLLIKGPVTPMVSALTIVALVALDRRWRWLAAVRPLRGLALVSAIAFPWAAATWIATDGAFFATAVGTDLAPKLVSGQESHGAPPGYHALLLVASLWPGSVFLLPALQRAWRERDTLAVRFCAAWILPAWIVFEAVPTKLPHYVLPLYPAMALLIAHAVLFAVDAPYGIGRRLTRVGAVIWAAVGVVLAVAAVAAPVVVGTGISAWSLIPAAAALAADGLVIRSVWQQDLLPAMAAAIGLGAVALATTLHLVLPRLTELAVSPAIAEAVRAIDPAGDRPVVIAGYAEPSVVFLLGTETRLAGSGTEAAAVLAADPTAIAVIEARQWPAFTEALPASPPVATAEVTGLNYSNGRRVVLQVIAGPPNRATGDDPPQTGP